MVAVLGPMILGRQHRRLGRWCSSPRRPRTRCTGCRDPTQDPTRCCNKPFVRVSLLNVRVGDPSTVYQISPTCCNKPFVHVSLLSCMHSIYCTIPMLQQNPTSPSASDTHGPPRLPHHHRYQHLLTLLRYQHHLLVLTLLTAKVSRCILLARRRAHAVPTPTLSIVSPE